MVSHCRISPSSSIWSSGSRAEQRRGEQRRGEQRRGGEGRIEERRAEQKRVGRECAGGEKAKRVSVRAGAEASKRAGAEASKRMKCTRGVGVCRQIEEKGIWNGGEREKKPGEKERVRMAVCGGV